MALKSPANSSSRPGLYAGAVDAPPHILTSRTAPNEYPNAFETPPTSLHPVYLYGLDAEWIQKVA
jgi:hypothetical protein